MSNSCTMGIAAVCQGARYPTPHHTSLSMVNFGSVLPGCAAVPCHFHHSTIRKRDRLNYDIVVLSHAIANFSNSGSLGGQAASTTAIHGKQLAVDLGDKVATMPPLSISAPLRILVSVSAFLSTTQCPINKHPCEGVLRCQCHFLIWRADCFCLPFTASGTSAWYSGI